VEYLQKLATIGSIEFDAEQIPDDPVALIYLAATLIQLPAGEKQAFLSANRASELGGILMRAYRRELGLMVTMPTEDIGIFSLN
jgi:hypothetical protein